MAFPFRQGLSMVYGDKRLRKYATRPLWLAAAIYVVVWVVAVAWLGSMLGGWIGGLLGNIGISVDQSVLLGRILVGAALIFFAQALFVGIASALGGMMFDKLSLEVERVAFGDAPEYVVPQGRMIMETMVRLGFAAFVGLLTLLTGWIFFGLIAAMIVGCLALVDLSAMAFARRGVTLPKQIGRAWRLKGGKRFVIASGLVSMVPLLNLFALPVLVATATLMVAEQDGMVMQAVESQA